MATSWTIGASPECDLVANRPGVSGRHCRLTFHGDGYTLVDLGSTNGTFVNGVRLNESITVTRLDAITLGPTASMPWPPTSGPVIVLIGRDPASDFVVDLPMVSGRHARVVWEGKPGEAWIEDLGSANGTAIGSPDRKISRAPLLAGDTIFLGSHAIPALVVLGRADPSLVPALAFRGNSAVIGRNPGCDRPIDVPMVSGQHARLSRVHGRLVIEDLGSANGTFVNAVRITGPTPVREGDLIGLGSYTTRLVVEPPSPEAARPLFALPASKPLASKPPEASPWPLVAAGLLAQAPVLALAIVALSGRSPDGVVFGSALAAVWFGLANATFVGRPGASGGSWEARLGIAAGLGLVQCLLLWGIVASLAGLVGPWGAGLLLLVLVAETGLALGLVVVSLIPRPPIAWAVVAVLMVPIWLFGGGPGAPVWSMPVVGAISNLMPSRWAFEGLLLPESAALAEWYFPAATERMGGRADLLAIGSLWLGVSATAAYVIGASGLVPRGRAGP